MEATAMEATILIDSAYISYMEGSNTSTSPVVNWYNKDANGYYIENLPSGRSGQYLYYCTRLEFNTKGMAFTGDISLTLKLTTSQQYGYAYGTTAIITKKELSSREIQKVQSEKDLVGIEAIGWANCEDEQKNFGQNHEVEFIFDKIPLQVNETYYIYLKRRFGLGYGTNVSGYYCSFYNPVVERFSDKSSLVLTYEKEPDYPPDSKIRITPDSLLVRSGQKQEIQFQLQPEDDLDLKNITFNWSMQIYNEENELLTQDQSAVLATLSDSGRLSITQDTLGNNYKIVVTAQWGSGSAVYSLSAVVTVSSHSPYIVDWIKGYVLGQLNAYIQYTER